MRVAIDENTATNVSASDRETVDACCGATEETVNRWCIFTFFTVIEDAQNRDTRTFRHIVTGRAVWLVRQRIYRAVGEQFIHLRTPCKQNLGRSLDSIDEG